MKKSIPSAKKTAMDAVKAKKGKLYLVSNAHLDTQWNWTVRDTIRECLKATLDDNFALLEKYPAYRMNFEGAFRYRLMKEYYPEKYEKMKGYIAEGRWNVAGSTWDAMDVNVPSSEALMRQVLLGNGYFEKEFGKKSADIFLTDCFGFRYALPSVAAHMGLSGFSTQKLVWGAGAPIIHTDGSVSTPTPGGGNVRMDLGKWIGPDGNGVYVSLLEGNYTYNFENDGDTPISEREEYLRDIEHNAKYAGAAKRSMYYGTGDYGGACKESSARMVQEAVDANGKEGSLFEAVSASTDQIFLELSEEEKAALPVYDGHLLIPHGYGAMTSHTASKRFNRKGELLADAAERLSMLAKLKTGREYPAERLREGWELLLWHQFHDDLPGTSIGEAYEFSHNDYAIALNIFASELTAAAGGLLASMNTAVEGKPIALFNPLSIARQDPVTVRLPVSEIPENPTVKASDGTALPTDLQMCEDGKTAEITFLPLLPPLSMTVFALTKGEKTAASSSPLSAGEGFLENAYLRVELNENGDISRIFDKKAGREVLSAPIELTVTPDNNTVWPSWELRYEDLFLPAEKVAGTPEITVRTGNAEASITVTRRYGESSFTQTVVLGRESRRVDVQNAVDWFEKESLLRAVFPLTVENETALFDQGLGAAPGGNTTSHPYFQHNVHQWASLTDKAGDYGVAILNDCKYGMEKPADGCLSLTLIHTPKGEYSHRSGQNFQDMGRNEFTFSVYPYTVKENGSALVPEEAARLNQPVIPFSTSAHAGGASALSMLGKTEDGLLVRCLKQEEKGGRTVLRVQECDGRAREKVTLPLGFAVTSAEETNGYEERIGDATLENGALVFPLGRYGVKTFVLDCPAEKRAQPVYTPLSFAPLAHPFDRKTTSAKASPADGELIPGSGISIPEELFPENIVCGGVPFWMGSAKAANAVSCDGQTLTVPAGSDYLHLLCCSTAGDKEVTFTVDGKPQTVTVPDVREMVGSWESVIRGTRPLLKRQEIAGIFTHLHDSKGEETVLPYDFAYLFKFTLPAGSALTLPKDPAILLFAATASKGGTVAAPLAPLYDVAEKSDRPLRRLTADGFSGGGSYPAGAPVPLHAPLLSGDSLFEGFRLDDGSEIPLVGGCTGLLRMPDRDATVRASMRKLGENLLLRRPCTASGCMSLREAPEKALDGSCEGKWCADSDEKGECILTVSLAERSKIGGYTVCHCGAFEGGQWNTDSFFIEYRDGDSDAAWQIADSVQGNREDITVRDFPPVYATEVRLRITKPARTKDTHCRIYQFHVYRAK